MMSSGKDYHAVVIGVGAMGGGMGKALVDSTLTKTVVGYDRSSEAAKKFFDDANAKDKAPESIPNSLDEAISGTTDFALLSLVNESQCEQVCFGGDSNLLSSMPKGSCVILTSTVTGKVDTMHLIIRGDKKLFLNH
jgi:3-hydroxyisobutyrate dehydrogenase-like beta-hydroxyacid dehydrogenase